MREDTLLLKAGTAVTNITPQKPVHLAGYPFVKRTSTGVHDSLLSTALYLYDGKTGILFVSNDVIYISKDAACRVRQRLEQLTGIPVSHIMITATHTHSGPSTVNFAAGSHDPLLPPVDEEYTQWMEEQIVKAALQAMQGAVAAEWGLGRADATGIGTNRHNPAAASDLEVPVLLVRKCTDKQIMACMLVCNMHPTVLHGNSTLISGDFPAMTRRWLQEKWLGEQCTILYHMGTAGNQSPRHVTRENTFAEAERIGAILGKAVILAGKDISFKNNICIRIKTVKTNLVKKPFPSSEKAADYVKLCATKLEAAKNGNIGRQKIRSAEVNWIGAVESLELSRMFSTGHLKEIYDKCLPAEISIFQLDDISFAGWPGEIFVEYGIRMKQLIKNLFMITLSNGELQGYIVTKEAAEKGVYEASNAIFDYQSGDMLVQKTVELLKNN